MDGHRVLRFDAFESERVFLTASVADGENAYEVDLADLWRALRDGTIGQHVAPDANPLPPAPKLPAPSATLAHNARYAGQCEQCGGGMADSRKRNYCGEICYWAAHRHDSEGSALHYAALCAARHAR